jgi:protein adenylyltransferase
MRVGFIHGVMNTDNMTLSGETIDYGPCAFMDNYDPNTVFSSIDHMGRYAYANQPKIAQWNLARLAETLLPLINDDFNAAIEVAEDTIKQFPDIYQRKWLAMMGAKLGLVESLPNDETLISDLLDWMRANNADYTNTFRDLSQAEKPKGQSYQDQAFAAWNARWQNRLNQTAQTTQSSLCLMKNSNPVVIPRNHKVEEALQAAHDQDFKPLRALLDALTTPYQDDAKLHAYQLPPEPNERVLQTFCGT